jgi:Uma2 family endonuclease
LYRARPGLQEYALVNYAYQGIELFRREKGHLWSFQTFLPDTDIELANLDIRFPVADVYQGIILPPGSEPSMIVPSV